MVDISQPSTVVAGGGSAHHPREEPLGFVVQERAGRALADHLRGLRPTFVCVLGHTDTCLVPGISAAGATPELRPLTPAADAEALLYGRARCLPGVPSNPLGPPGPAIIARAALELAELPCVIVDAGTRVHPQTPAVVLGTAYGRHIADGRAVPEAGALFGRGLRLGRQVAQRANYLVIGESVPAGTTTAMAVLVALGYRAEGRVSSSLGENAHQLKSGLVRAALAASGLDVATPQQTALQVVAAVGDPMQPVVAGMALGALERCPVLLAGGTQMVAVLALMKALARERGERLPRGGLALATTRWVVDDPTSDFAGLLAEVAPLPALCTTLSFAASRHEALRLYERFLVKEGVGAGGAAVAATLASGTTLPQLLERVEHVYEALQGEWKDEAV